MSAVQFELMAPDEWRAARERAPVAYVPLGTLEWHGYHLPVGLDALKAHALCVRIAQRTGGVVLPPTYWGVGGGHGTHDGSIIVEAEHVEPLLVRTFDRLAEMGFRVIVAITGHYPTEQVEMVQRAVRAHMAKPGAAFIWAGPEYLAFARGQPRADHAAKWETSILLALRPELVHLERLSDGREEPLYGVRGADPREATRELGEETVGGIVETLAGWVQGALAASRASQSR